MSTSPARAARRSAPKKQGASDEAAAEVGQIAELLQQQGPNTQQAWTFIVSLVRSVPLDMDNSEMRAASLQRIAIDLGFIEG